MRTIILSLADGPDAGCGGCASLCGTDNRSCLSPGPRVPVLACRDALVAAGHEVELITARSDKEIDAVIAGLDGPARPDGLTWPAAEPPGALVVAVESDSQLRAVVRRMVRRYAPPPSKRPTDVADGRTMPDLPPIGILPLVPAMDLADRLGLPRDGADVAKAVIAGRVRRVDLFRNDGGSITLHGALLGGVGETGEAAAWTGAVIVDNTVLADGREPVLACAVANANGYAHVDEIPLAPQADASSGVVAVAVAVPVVVRSRLGRSRVRIEVRRASGRAVSVSPRTDLPFIDDGVAGVLTRKRSWWIEPGAWGVFTT
ncbi:MAG TPA: hypothetical protein VGF84_24570 [Micromonosporaceae bacterium]